MNITICPIFLIAYLLQWCNAQTIPCGFLLNAPVLDVEIPSALNKLKFLNVEAKVYRQTLASGSKPRLRFIRYSSKPTVDVDDDKILISTDTSPCSKETLFTPEEYTSSATGLSTVLVKILTTSSIAAGFIATSNIVNSSFFGWFLLTASSFPQSTFASEQNNLDCIPTMEVILEAPPYYLGSVAECLSSVSNPDHCPEPFPEFSKCSDIAPSCKLGVVGAGTGGLYSAYRLVEEGVFDGTDVCIFEATDRVGGRLYSLRGFGPENDISVDAGGYRTWPNFTPTTHALITETLGLNVSCYDEDFPCKKFNIVGESGEKIGFATFVEELMSRLLDQGACFFPRHNLVSILHNDDGSNTLSFANGVTTTPSHSTILNVPQRSVLEILRESDLFPDDMVREEKNTFDSLHSVQTEIVTKLYLYYEDAWWYKLGLRDGDFEMAGDARNMLLKGRYHDGHIKCRPSEDGTDSKCYGFLLAVYAHDFSGTKAQYFRRFQRDRPEPVTILSNTNPEEEEFLEHAHKRLVEYHVYEDSSGALNASSYSPFQFRKIMESAQPPTFAVLANWNTAAFGAGGGWHHWTDMSNADMAMKPLNMFGIHIINEAFSKLQGWAEGSLLLADEVLEEYFDVARPWDFDVPDSIFYLAQTSSEECVVEDDSASVVSGVSSASGSQGGGGNVDPCFIAGSLVELGNGTMVPIEFIKDGDLVNTGVDGKIGLVTKKLVHPVEGISYKLSDVVVVSTTYGELVGTSSHPVLIADENSHKLKWIELGNAFDTGMLVNSHRELREVDIFYNLEVDGHQPGKSTHSYIVNGMVASGLGDDPTLNRMFPRQKIWEEHIANNVM